MSIYVTDAMLQHFKASTVKWSQWLAAERQDALDYSEDHCKNRLKSYGGISTTQEDYEDVQIAIMGVALYWLNNRDENITSCEGEQHLTTIIDNRNLSIATIHQDPLVFAQGTTQRGFGRSIF